MGRRPDIAIDYKNGYSIILDAKNSDYNRSGPYSYRPGVGYITFSKIILLVMISNSFLRLQLL
jgi:hypothetical protein